MIAVISSIFGIIGYMTGAMTYTEAILTLIMGCLWDIRDWR